MSTAEEGEGFWMEEKDGRDRSPNGPCLRFPGLQCGLRSPSGAGVRLLQIAKNSPKALLETAAKG